VVASSQMVRNGGSVTVALLGKKSVAEHSHLWRGNSILAIESTNTAIEPT